MADLNVDVPGKIAAHGDQDTVVVAKDWAGTWKTETAALNTILEFIAEHGLTFEYGWSETDDSRFNGGGSSSQTYLSPRLHRRTDPNKPWIHPVPAPE